MNKYALPFTCKSAETKDSVCSCSCSLHPPAVCGGMEKIKGEGAPLYKKCNLKQIRTEISIQRNKKRL